MDTKNMRDIWENKAETVRTDKVGSDFEEPIVFSLKDKYHEFSIGLTEVLKMLVIAEEEGFTSKLPEDWWKSVSQTV